MATNTYDISGSARTSTSSSVSLSASVSNEVAIIFLWTVSSDTVVSCTVGGVAADFVSSVTPPGSPTQTLHCYKFYNPPTSLTVYNAVASSNTIEIHALLYTNATPTTQIDSFAVVDGMVTPLELTDIVVYTNCWLVSCARDYDSGAQSAGTGTTNRISGVGFNSGDSNAVAGTGAQTLEWIGNSGGENMFGIVVAILSTDSVGPTPGPYPDSIDSYRTIANLPGLSFDATKQTALYAEDIQALRDSIIAIENTLGLNPEGSFDTVVDRLNSL